MDIVKRIASMMRPYRKTMVMVFALQLIVILTRLIVPIITETIVNDVITAGNLTILPPLCAALLSLVVLRGACTYIRSVSNERVAQNLAFDIRTGLYRHLEELPYEFYDKHRIGEIMSRMTGDLEGVRNMIAGGLITAFDNALMFFGALIFMGAMSIEMLLLLILFLPVIGATAFAFNKRIRPVFANIREQNAVLNTRTQENLAGVRVVKAFAREDYEEERFYEDNQTLLKLNLRATYVWSRFVPLMELLSGLCTPVALIGGALLTASGRMDVGTLVGVTGYIWMLTNPVRVIGDEKGYVTGIECIKMELGEPDEKGRRRPMPVEGSNFVLEVDAMIDALGTSPNPLLRMTTPGLEADKHGCLIADEKGKTTHEGVFAGGDAVTGAATVILAMGAGKLGAKSIDEALSK